MQMLYIEFCTTRISVFSTFYMKIIQHLEILIFFTRESLVSTDQEPNHSQQQCIRGHAWRQRIRNLILIKLICLL